MLKFDPLDPFPDEARVMQSGADYQGLKEHAAAVDQWLGLETEKVERALLPSPEHELWIGKPVQVFSTPYTEFREILERLQVEPGEKVIDLGAGYGRMAHVLARHFPKVSFAGYEFLSERCREGRRVFDLHSLKSAALIEADVTGLDFSKETAKYFFMYDFGSRADVEKTLENLKTAKSMKPLVLVARGGRSRDIVEKKHGWLSGVVRPQHFEHYSIYRTVDV